ncbi:MAG: GDSL-type esterase/lipase family protein [Thermoguttaceae bacterium]|nr:GDSL-type esterase/lipase family protein [Thermoguttaceae bacterium]
MGFRCLDPRHLFRYNETVGHESAFADHWAARNSFLLFYEVRAGNHFALPMDKNKESLGWGNLYWFVFMRIFEKAKVMRALKYCFAGLVLGIVCLLFVSSASAERVVIVGDSITGHSMNLPFGYVHEMRRALKDAGVTDIEIAPLGWSGSTVQSWIPVVEQSRTVRRKFDIPNIFCKDEFDKGADTLIVFLGMNDATKPTVQLTDASLTQWKKDYQKLLDLLKVRVPWRKLILCPPTMLTEDPWSNRNELMDKMSLALIEVAKANHATICDIRGEYKKHFINARMTKSDFFMTKDCVHPQREGHALMAWSLLKSIGQEKVAATYYIANVPEFVRDFTIPGMCLFVSHGNEGEQVTVRGFLRGADVKSVSVVAPEGFVCNRITAGPAESFTILLSGHMKSACAELEVKAGNMSRVVRLNAPFYVASPLEGNAITSPQTFNWDAENTQLDRDVLAGKDPLQTRIDGKPVRWLTCYPTQDVTGRMSADSVDFASLSDMTCFDKGYVVRRVYSQKAQPATLRVAPDGFSTTDYARVWLNGKQVCQEGVSPRLKVHDLTVQVELQQGWNTLVARVNHTEWQWAITLNLVGEGLSY